VKSLQELRGVQLRTGAIIAAELGDLSRFGSAPKLMAYLGLVPLEYSSRESKQRGRITRTGNSHARRVLVESAWVPEAAGDPELDEFWRSRPPR
jgi:transposase